MPLSTAQFPEHFTPEEFACKCGTVKINRYLVEQLSRLRQYIGIPITVTSGYRCSTHNREVGGSPTSYHMFGMAADVTADMPYWKFYRAADYIWSSLGGIGIYPGAWFLHLDVRDEAARWAKVNGVYIPFEEGIRMIQEANR